MSRGPKAVIRTTKTGSGATAVQVVYCEAGKTHILKHVGSTRSTEELHTFIDSAEQWLQQQNKQSSLFQKPKQKTISLESTVHLYTLHTFARDTLFAICKKIGLDALNMPILIDMALMRIIEPSSKLRTIDLVKRYFHITYTEKTLYRALKDIVRLKSTVEGICTNFALKTLKKKISLVLYDVTTLYFESFKEYEFQKPGFSKDNKPQQPQIVVGLLVTRDGFPLGYEVFKGNTFEGHTMLPVFESFLAQHDVETPTIVADAAMLSVMNMNTLKEKGYSYIVGARLANAPEKIVNAIKTMKKEDGSITRIKNTKHGDLIIAFSSKRERKDRNTMEKQWKRAEGLVASKEPGRMAKFVAKDTEYSDSYVLNTELKTKTEVLLGMKGYYTNISKKTLSDMEVIAHYGDLWNVEASFRISKYDLMTRPIFHHTEDSIRAHMVIAFIALAMSRYIQGATDVSIRRFRDGVWDVCDAHLQDTVTKEVFVLRSQISEDLDMWLKKCLTY